MKIADIFRGQKDEISITINPAIENEKFNSDNYIDVKYSQDTYWLLSNDNNRIEIAGVNPQDKKELDRIINKHFVLYITNKETKKIELKVKLFTNSIISKESIEIGLTDIIIDDINKRYSRKRQQQKHVNWLSNELIIENNMILVYGHNKKSSGFRVFGKSIAIDVIINKDNKHEIKRILNLKKKLKPDTILKSTIEIKDISTTATLRSNIESELKKINSTEKYIRTWEKYKEIEIELNKENVIERGFLTITTMNKTDEKTYKLDFKNDKNTKNWLKINIGEFVVLSKNQTHTNENESLNNNQDNIICELLKKENTYISVVSEKEITTDYKFASLSTLGNDIMNKRRDKALEEIRNNSTPMPALPAVLEGIEYNYAKRRKIRSLTTKVKKEFGEHGPNTMQEHALDIALNTPDIAIIQGPPGTGKTKVITALAKRLTEIYKDNGEAPEMNILLSAFQHDAVENMASRTEVLGLPAIKFSTKQNQSIDSIEKWIDKQTEKIEASQFEIEPNETELTYKKVFSSYLNYIETLNHEKAKIALSKFGKDNIITLPANIIDHINTLTKKEKETNSKINKKIIDLINNIRSNATSYQDDGETNLNRLIKNYDLYKDEVPEIKEEELLFFKKILANRSIDNNEYKKLNELKIELLDRFKSIKINKTIKLINSNIEQSYKLLIDFFSSQIKENGSVYSVLSEFQNDLKANKQRVTDTIQNYVALAAATVQGSKSRNMFKVKPDPFDTVIVDEAARANPLDLLIPLTSAKRRIILVGDHRQLPHIIDNAIQKRLEDDKDAAKDVSKFLENSLFERFYTILKKLQDKDGVQRVVTLDTQYRMHPKIGDFISKTFYEKYGDPKINSGTDSKLLTHKINQYKGKVAVSINIPNNKEEEKKHKGSTFRPIEAKEAIYKAKEILDNDPSISIGIITFYKEQVNTLFKEAAKVKMVERIENKYHITEKYKKTIKGDERFRIGSVDAFQGKEFDVVILSLVRSNNIKNNIRRKYGFLTSYNRLNVAMSRAKMLLITIGDENMFRTEEAKKNIYGLYAFYNNLIDTDYGISI